MGLRLVDPGNYLQPSDANGIVVITQIDPISVVFTTPESNLPRISARLNSGVKLPVTVLDRDNVHALATGTLTTFDSQIDVTTGTIRMRSTFDNPNGVLFPNQFVNVRLLVDTMTGVTLAPNPAIQLGASGNFVYLLNDNSTVSKRDVVIGPTDGKHTVITSGLKAGDKVVIDGVDRLRDGAKVKVVDNPAPRAAQAEAVRGSRRRGGIRGGVRQRRRAASSAPPRPVGRRRRIPAPPAAEGQALPATGAADAAAHAAGRRARPLSTGRGPASPTHQRAPPARPRMARRRRATRRRRDGAGLGAMTLRPLRAEAVNPSRIFIDRPVATSLLMIAILLVGMMAFRFLPLSALPEVDYPTIQVQTFYPGASPEVMTSAVTAPLERQFGQMASLSQMMSQSSAGASIITLRFGLDIGLDIAEQEVQQAINAAGNLLPADLPAPPIYAKVNPADAPILTLGVASDSMKLTEVEDIIETRLVPKLSQLPGVGLVSISGGQRPAVRIHVNPLALSSLGVNLDDLRTTIANLNVNTPKGNFDGPAQSSAINANDQIRDPNDYAKSVIAYRNGAPVRLSDVAKVEIGPENGRLKAWMNTTPALIVNIQRQPGANVIKVVDSVKALLPTLRESLPAAITVTPLTDRTITIRASVEDVEFELALAVGLVVMVIFLFLRNIPATIIPSLSVPLSLIGALAIMYQAGFQPRQSVADGADRRDRLRRRRRDRGDREHRALSRARRQSLRRGDEGFGADRLHHHFAHRVADRGSDPAPVHGRRRRAAVPRVRDHARRRHHPFRRGLAHPGADAVRQASAPAGSWRRGERRAVFPGSDPFLWRDAAGRAQSSRLHASGRARHVPADRLPLYDDPEGLLSDPGHRRHPGRDPGGGSDFIRPDGRPSTGAGESDPDRSGRRKPVLVHRRRRLERHAQLGPLPHQP